MSRRRRGSSAGREKRITRSPPCTIVELSGMITFAVADDGPHQRAVRHVEQRELQADDPGALGGDELDALDEVLAERADGHDLSRPRELDDRVEGDAHRADDAVDAYGGGEGGVARGVDEADHPPAAEALGEQGDDDVVGLAPECGDEQVGALHALVDQQALVMCVAEQDERVARARGRSRRTRRGRAR